MTAHDGALVAAGGEERVPRTGVDARHAESGRVLGERDRVAALRRESAHLGRGGVGVEQRHDPARDEAVRVRAAPLVDVPVVVGADHHEVHVAVGSRAQDLAREPGPVREVQPRELAAGRHVEHAGVDVVAAGAHVLVAQRIDVEHLRRLARDRVQPEVPAAELAVVPLQPAARLLHDAWHAVAVPRRARGRRTCRPARRCGRRPTPGRAAPGSTPPSFVSTAASANAALASRPPGHPKLRPMDLGLAGAAVVVSGGSKGMGRAAALTFAAEGARVAVLARGRDALDATVAALRRGREPRRDRHRGRPHRARRGRRRVRRDRRPVGRVQRARQRGRTGRGRHPSVRGPRRRRVDGHVRHRDAERGALRAGRAAAAPRRRVGAHRERVGALHQAPVRRTSSPTPRRRPRSRA